MYGLVGPEMTGRAAWYCSGVFVAAAAVSVLLAFSFPVVTWFPVLILMVLAFITENLAFELSVGTSVSLSFALIYAALLNAGPFAAVLCALAVSIPVADFRKKKPVLLMAFNAGQASLSAGLAAVTYVLAGGDVVSLVPTGHVSLPAAGLSAVVFYAVNVTLVSLVISIRSEEPVVAVLKSQGFLSYAGSLIVLALLGIMIAELLALGSWAGLLLLVLPFMAARRTFRVYAELSEAYTSTVRSLVTALEAKDEYTCGHSERVAVYARALAESLGLPRVQVELVERAALLHDVGKIGIPLDTLTSPAKLSPGEVRLVHQHPDVGSRLVSDVEFLSDVVPVIRHHHERVDGAGYPDRLIGEEIPMMSRLLAVADAYDAMTSTRAYRLAMSTETAVLELRRVAGAQLDMEMTGRFIRLVEEDALRVVQ